MKCNKVMNKLFLVGVRLLGCCLWILQQRVVAGQFGSAPAWELPSYVIPPNSQLERESTIVFNPALSRVSLTASSRPTPFTCVDWSPEEVDQFVRTYNRSYDKEDEIEKITRHGLLKNTFKRVILLNRVIENDIHNSSEYTNKPSIGDYYYLQPSSNINGATNKAFLWYADITDCELGIIKYVMFEIFDRIDQNDFAGAYSLVLSNVKHLPLLNADGWEQLCNILLVRLFDRFEGDHQMKQLYKWPTYLRKLATFAYSQRQIAQPDFKKRIALISFIYPTYFRDVKYNPQAIDRTNDNEKAHEAHEEFNNFNTRVFTSIEESNRRLVNFRQRWTLLNRLSDVRPEWRNNVSIVPEWLYQAKQNEKRPNRRFPSQSQADKQESEKLLLDRWYGMGNQQEIQRTAMDSSFSDMTDAEFVAMINSDYSGVVGNNKEFKEFLKHSYKSRPLDEDYLNELALELEFRRNPQGLANGPFNQPEQRDSFKLARSVIEELVSQVGIPIGAYIQPKEFEMRQTFEQFIRHHNKTYASLDDSERRDEKQRRFNQFAANNGPFRAWFDQEGWILQASKVYEVESLEKIYAKLLMLSDMSWWEIKFTLFKVCCLERESKEFLVRTNATIEYLASHEFLCEPLVGPQQNEMAALEIYYYYSVFYNKHHLDMDSFYKAFSIFRHNLDQLKRLSCPRSLTLELALRERKGINVLNTVDTLDRRRITTDDLNLDRFKYFTIPNLSSPPDRDQAPEFDMDTNGGSTVQNNPVVDYTLLIAGNGSSVPGRKSDRLTALPDDLIHRIDPANSYFSRVLDYSSWERQQSLMRNKSHSSSSKRLERLVALKDLDNVFGADNKRYHSNNAGRIYDLVMQRYKFCVELVRNLDPDNVPKQRCRSTGTFTDSSVNWLVENQLTDAQSRELREKDQCSHYLLGLEAWSAGLLKQDPKSAMLIEQARC